MLSLCVTICRSALSWVGGQHWERLCICPWAFSGSSSSTKKSPPWPAVSGSSSRETRSTSLGQPEWLHPSLSCGRSWWDSFTDDVVQPEPQTGFGVFFLHQFHDVSLHLQSSLVQLSFQRQTQRNLTILVHSHDLQRRRCLSGETAITLVKIIWTDSLTATEQLLQRQRSIHLQTQGMNTNIIHSHSLCKSRN